jgi:hypothetical protein
VPHPSIERLGDYHRYKGVTVGIRATFLWLLLLLLLLSRDTVAALQVVLKLDG